MTDLEIEQLLFLLRKFHAISSTSILDIEMKIIQFAVKTPTFQLRDGIVMDEKMAYEHD